MTLPEYVKQNKIEIEKTVRKTYPNAVIENDINLIEWMVLMHMIVEAHRKGVSKASCRYWYRRFDN
ncbi:MAG: hypothetical protein GY941_21810 [Planctomycetes bacterium]|nr:hypothetical protein [Planctomycetota bacterium]